MAITATKFVAQYRRTNPARVAQALGLCWVVTTSTGLICTLGMLIFSKQLALLISGDANIIAPALLSALQVLFVVVNGYQVGALMGFGKFRELAFASFFASLLAVCLPILLSFKYHLTGAFLGAALASLGNWLIFQTVLGRILAHEGIQIEKKITQWSAGVFREFALPSTLAGIVSSLATWGAGLMLVNLSSFSEMAFFSVANSFKNVVAFIPSVVTRVASPYLVSLVGTGNLGGFHQSFNRYLIGIAVTSLVSALPLILLSAPLTAIFGPEYLGASNAIKLMCLFSVVESLREAVFQKSFSSGRMWWGFWFCLIRALLIVGIGYAYVRTHGSVGIANAHLVGALVAVIANVIIFEFYYPGKALFEEEAGEGV